MAEGGARAACTFLRQRAALSARAKFSEMIMDYNLLCNARAGEDGDTSSGDRVGEEIKAWINVFRSTGGIPSVLRHQAPFVFVFHFATNHL